MPSYICMACYTSWPCANLDHRERYSNMAAMPSGLDVSIPCFVFDHAQCSVSLFCTCHCHKKQADDDTSDAPLHQSLAEQ